MPGPESLWQINRHNRQHPKHREFCASLVAYHLADVNKLGAGQNFLPVFLATVPDGNSSHNDRHTNSNTAQAERVTVAPALAAARSNCLLL